MASVSEYFTPADILAVAEIHPFYNANVTYPPTPSAIREARERVAGQKGYLRSWPLLWKKDLYSTIERLVDDTSPDNTFRHSVYTSITGGGSGSKPLFFATDVHENRHHRAQFGRFLRNVGILTERDWVLTLHTGGELYRSLDLTLETQENAGATVLSGGSQLEPDDVIRIVTQYHVNVLTGDTSCIVRMVHHISTLPPAEREKIKLDKIIYTSEPLTPAQRAHIETVLPNVSICSVLGSSEAGPYAATCQLSEQNALAENGGHTPAVNGTVNGVNGVNGVSTAYQDFVIDTRLVWIDILPKSVNEGDRTATSLPDGQEGLVALTSLSRLRNPLVRYMTGDLGSLHPLSPHSAPLVPEADRPHLYILRLRGRDSRFSFDWDGNYIEFKGAESMMNNPEYQILQWQIIREKMMPSLETSLEVRVLCAVDADRQKIEKMIKIFLHVCQGNEHCFRLVFVNGLEDFERSSTGRKTIKFVDRV